MIFILIFILTGELKSQQDQNFEYKTTEFGIANHTGNSYQGSGISAFDFDSDGWVDLCFGTDLGDEIHMYRNIEGNSFQRISGLIPNGRLQKQILWVDFDNDKDYDLFVTARSGQNSLYVNDGNFNFTDVTQSSGLAIENSASCGAVFGDVNNDGYLDLFVSNLVPSSKFYINNGDGTFTDSTEIFEPNATSTLNFVAAFVDFDNDGDLDLYKSNDKHHANQLFENEGNLVFTEVGAIHSANIVINAMNTGVGDINNDGDWDLFVTDGPDPGSTLLKYNGQQYENLNPSSNTDFNSWTWGGVFSDFDNDGFEDIYVSSMIALSTDQNKLYFNNGDETFTEQETSNMPYDFKKSYATVTADFNNDGKIDIATNNGSNTLPSVWINQIENNNNFIKINLVGRYSNKDAIGTRIEVYSDNETFYRLTNCGINYLSQQSQYYHIGIGSNNSIDSIKLVWPRGKSSTYRNVEINQLVSFNEALDYPIYACDNNRVNYFDMNPIPEGIYNEKNYISSGSIPAGDSTSFKYNEFVNLESNFTVNLGANFTIEMKLCYP